MKAGQQCPCQLCGSPVPVASASEVEARRALLIEALPDRVERAFWSLFQCCDREGLTPDFDGILTLLAQGVDAEVID